VAGARRGRVGLAGEPVEPLLCAGKREKGSEEVCSPREKKSGDFADEGEAAAMEFDDGGLGNAPARWRRGREPVAWLAQ
jgi:hypothetical protein